MGLSVYPNFWPVEGEHDEQQPELGYLTFRQTQMFPDVWRIDWPVYWSFVSRSIWDFTLTAGAQSCNDIPLFLGIMTVIHYICILMSILVLGSDMCLELRDEIIPRYIYIIQLYYMYVNEHTWQHAKPKRTKQRKDNMYALFVLYIIVSYVVIVCSWVSQKVHMFSYIYIWLYLFENLIYLFI